MADRENKTEGMAPGGPAAGALLQTLRERFERHMERHPGLTWAAVERRLKARPEALAALDFMERTGGEPDVVSLTEGSEDIIYVDCAAESPAGRRSLCYDRAALDARKENKPAHSAMGLAEEQGLALLDEEQYRALQRLGQFDRKTSSWVLTPPAMRKLGGALFCDRRYERVFAYHNGADSYYAARGFRAWLKV